MFSQSEKNDLLIIIRGIYGRNNFAEKYVNNFNEQTAEAVRNAFNDIMKCNSHVKELVLRLVAGAALSKEKFRKSLNIIAKAMNNDKVTFNGMLCNSIKGWRRTKIEETFY